MGWVLANVFLFGVVGIAAGYFWLFGSFVKWGTFSEDVEPYLFAIAAVVSLVATYFTAKAIHALIDRSLRRR